MQINLSIDTRNDAELFALQAFVDSLCKFRVAAGLPEGFDRGTGPLKDFESKKVTIHSTDEKGEWAKQQLNLDDSVEEVKLQTIPKGYPPKGEEVVVDCGNKISLEAAAKAMESGEPGEPKTLEGKTTFTDEEQEATRKKAAAILAKKKKAAAKSEPLVDVETNDASVKDGSIDAALDQLDPEPPSDKPVDHAVAIRKLMVEVVKAHGPKGAKLASKVVNEIAGVKDVTKIPADKFEAVKEGLLAAVVPGDAPTTKEPEPPSTKAVDKKPDAPQEDAPSADDVDF